MTSVNEPDSPGAECNELRRVGSWHEPFIPRRYETHQTRLNYRKVKWSDLSLTYQSLIMNYFILIILVHTLYIHKDSDQITVVNVL